MQPKSMGDLHFHNALCLPALTHRPKSSIATRTTVGAASCAHNLILGPEWPDDFASARATLATPSWVNDPGALCCSRTIEIRSLSHQE